MHIHKYAELATFSEIGIGGNLPATEEYREFIKKLHPTQLLTGRLTAPLYEVTYSYETVRGNSRKAQKYVFLRLEHEDIDIDIEIEMMMSDWVNQHNSSYPYRKITNVNILEICPIAYATLSLEA